MAATRRSSGASIVNDPTYRRAFMERALTGKLPPALEVMLFHYLFGQPVAPGDQETPPH